MKAIEQATTQNNLDCQLLRNKNLVKRKKHKLDNSGFYLFAEPKYFNPCIDVSTQKEGASDWSKPSVEP